MMMRSFAASLLALALVGAAPAGPKLDPVPKNAQTEVVRAYLRAVQSASYDAAFALLNDDARAYYRTAANFRSIFDADRYRLQKFSLIGARGDAKFGRVFFARETAAFHDPVHDVDATVEVTTPLGVVPTKAGWRIKDPGHPWRAFATHASGAASGVQITVKKVSFYPRRIEVVATFANRSDVAVTLLPYGKSVLRDASGTVYRIIESKDWTLTDKTLFEGARLVPNAQYTGTLAFECAPLDDASRVFALTVAPALASGADVPFSIEIDGIAPEKSAGG